MESFELYNPVRVQFGEGQVSRLSDLVPPRARVLLTYGGGSIKRNGVYGAVREALGTRHVVDFGGIEANPHYETLMEALPVIEREKIDFLLAVGGGSVIDGTKFIAAAACFNGADKWSLMGNKGSQQIVAAMPFGVVLTHSATGSEMNRGAVITRATTREKLSFSSEHTFPRFAVIDPRYMLSLPLHQVANGVVDAFVHVVEQYLTYPVDARVQDRFSEGLLSTLVEIGPALMEHPEDMGLRSNLSVCALLALNGLIASGVPEDWSTHMIGHELTALYGLDHAVSLAVVLPALLRDQMDVKSEKLAQCGRRVFGLTGSDTRGVAERTVEAIEDFLRRMLGKIRLSDYGVDRDGARVVWERFAERGWKMGERRTVDAAAVERILLASL